MKSLFRIGNAAKHQKFSGYQNTTRNMLLLSAVFMLGMYFWDVVIDPIGAQKTLKYRIVITAVLLLIARLISMQAVQQPVKKILLGGCALLCVAALFTIYMQLEQGFIYGIAGFVYIQFSLLVCFLCLTSMWAAILHLTGALIPHLLAFGLGVESFPHVHYAITIWPAAIMVIGAQELLQRDFLFRLSLTNRLKALATIDPLTGVSNRRSFWESAPKLLALASRQSCSLSILMIDIDNFKRVNDVHGHDVGDEVLVLLSRCIHEQTRQEEIFCRWGGEEFVVLLAESTQDAGLILANRIIGAVRAIELPLKNGGMLHFTTSIGIASHRDGNIKNLIHSADAALYTAKASGKNCIKQYPKNSDSTGGDDDWKTF